MAAGLAFWDGRDTWSSLQLRSARNYVLATVTPDFPISIAYDEARPRCFP